MKSFNIVCLSLVLSACGGGGSSSSGGSVGGVNTGGETGEISTLDIFGIGEEYEHSGDGTYDIDITGLNHSITTTANQTINNLTVDGSNIILFVGAGSTIQYLEISGNDNSISVPDGSYVELEITGSGNQLIEY